MPSRGCTSASSPTAFGGFWGFCASARGTATPSFSPPSASTSGLWGHGSRFCGRGSCSVSWGFFGFCGSGAGCCGIGTIPCRGFRPRPWWSSAFGLGAPKISGSSFPFPLPRGSSSGGPFSAIPRGVESSVSCVPWRIFFWVSLCAQGATLGFVGSAFGYIPLYGILANLLLIPWTGAIIWTGLSLLVLSPAGLAPALGKMAEKFLIQPYLDTVSWVSNLPGAALPVGRYFGLWWAFAALVLVAFWGVSPRGSPLLQGPRGVGS